MNLPVHGLNKKELKILLFELLSKHELVAMKNNKELFTPSLEEIENALNEVSDLKYRFSNTFYGITSAAIDSMVDLKKVYET